MYKYIYRYKYMYSIPVYPCICVSVYLCICVYVYMCICVCVYMCIYVFFTCAPVHTDLIPSVFKDAEQECQLGANFSAASRTTVHMFCNSLIEIMGRDWDDDGIIMG